MQKRFVNRLSWVSVYPDTSKVYATVEEGDVGVERTMFSLESTMKMRAQDCVVPETITSLSSHTDS